MRTTATILTGVALVAILTLLCLAPARGTTSRGYQAVSQSAFTPLPIEPLERPVRPTDAPRATIAPVVVSVTPRPVRTAIPRGNIGTAVGAVKGSCSFYAYVPGGAAAAARLRDAIGPNWRNKRVTVWYGSRHVVVVLSDFESSLIPGRLIDLNEASFAQLVGPGWYQRGRVTVRVVW